MTDLAPVPYTASPRPSLVTMTHAVYALHACGLVLGIISSASIIGSFLLSIPSLVGLVLNYIYRGDAEGTYLASHFSWQIRTFWLAAGWVVLGWLLAITIIGFPVAVCIWIGLTIWVIYRIARGWMTLSRGDAIVTIQ